MKFNVYANAAEFGIIAAGSAQEARDIAAQMAGYESEADMEKQIEQKSEIVAVEVETAKVSEGNQFIGEFTVDNAPNEFIRALVREALENGEATATDEQGCSVTAVLDQ